MPVSPYLLSTPLSRHRRINDARGQLTESNLFMGTNLRELVHTFRQRTRQSNDAAETLSMSNRT
jgi:hypothetical protein